MGVLNGIRVIDFGQYIAGPLTAGLLADYGADVVRIDAPGGPRWHTPANAIWNRGKRSIALDLKKADENDVARRLIEGADVVVENFRPEVMDRLHLGVQAMMAANPRLIYCSLPGFASDDPRASIPAWEGVIAAATNTYRPPHDGSSTLPVFSAIPIASNFAAYLATTAIIAALIARERDGLGQHIEVPLFDAMFTAIGTLTLLPPSQIPLDAPGRAFDPYGGGFYRCSDNQWVLFNTFRYRFLVWFVREAGLDSLREEGLLDPEWNLATSDRLRARFVEVFATRPAHEWEEIGTRAGVPISRVRTAREWLETEHARVSSSIIEIDDPEYGRMLQPGAAVRLVRTPAVFRPRRPLNADREAILAETTKPAERERSGSTGLQAALAGIRVLDLTQMWAGPATGRLLAEFGAEVIKITDPDDAHFSERFHLDVNRGKRTILLNLQTREGLEVFSHLAASADVVVQNSVYGAADRLGIGYEAVSHLRPDIVYASISSCGYAGPWRARRGYEPHGSALTGMMRMGDGVSRGQPFALNDWGTGVLGALAVTLGLFHRLRTGQGQEVEASLVQTATWHQTPFLYTYAGKQEDEPRGLRVRGWGPLQRLYLASDGWLFLGASEHNLHRLEMIPALAGISKLRGEVLAAFLEKRIAENTAQEWMERLNSVGTGAQALVSMQQLQTDPWVLAHGLVITRDHPGAGKWTTIGPTLRLSRTPLQAGHPVPPLGADAPAVLKEIGMRDRLDELVEKRVISLLYAAHRPV